MTTSPQPIHSTADQVPQCLCGFDAVYRKVSKAGKNQDRYFWGCPRFGTYDHPNRCEYFRWADSLNDDAADEPISDFADEGGLGKTTPNSVETPDTVVSSSSHETSTTPNTPTPSGTQAAEELVENGNVNSNANSNANRHVHFGEVEEEVFPIEEEERQFWTGASTPNGNNGTNNRTPMTKPIFNTTKPLEMPKLQPRRDQPNKTTTPQSNKYKYYNPKLTYIFPRIISQPKRRVQASPSSNSSLGVTHSIPRFTTPELLTIIDNHLNRQDRVVAAQEFSKESARTEVKKLTEELERVKGEISFLSRENQLLKGEKRVLERDLDVAKDEIVELKRRRTNQ